MTLEAQLSSINRQQSPADRANLTLVHRERDRLERELATLCQEPPKWGQSSSLFQ